MLGGSLGVDPVGDRVAEGDDGREAGLCGSGLGGECGGREEPTTPVPVSAATPAARAVPRCILLGRRCLPGARVNAMYRLVLSFLSPTGLADGFGAGRSPTDPLATRAGVRFTPGTVMGPRLPGSRRTGTRR
ncbi:hypothetical protein SHKM778_23530 [Streptomyces sp. KM77-8]|uniref:Uncharacterized protein n=1 Tax=Streptomyces haneummycinicus TaxID=3074435 RepID=A0AAT9HEU9_9ACTN